MSPDPVGSLAEEAAKLVSALSSFQTGHASGDDRDEGDEGDDGMGGSADTHEAHDPLAPECRYCPLCALARAARSMTPEVREHLASAAGSLLLAVRGIVEEAMARPEDSGDDDEPAVEKIDLAED